MAKTKLSTEEAVKEIALLNIALKELRNNLKTLKASDANFDQLILSNKKARETYMKLNKDIARLKASIDRKKAALNSMTAAQEKATRGTKKSTDATEKDTKATDKNTSAKKKSQSAFVGLLKSARALLGAFGLLLGVQLFADIIKNAFKLTLTFDSLRFAMEKITETAWEYEQAQQFLLELNRDYGAELIVTTERWLRFRAAAIQSNMTLLETEKIFRSVTKAAAVMGLSTDELRSVYLALEQMLSKGNVTTEELRRQLGERLPGAFGIMAASMGITIRQLDDLLQKGEVLSSEVLPDFADALEIAYGIEAVEKVDTLRSAVNRLAGSWQTFVSNIGEGEGVMARVLNIWMGHLSKFADMMVRLTANEDQLFRLDIIDPTDNWEQFFEDEATKAIEAMDQVANVRENLRAAIEQNKIQIGLTVDEDEIKALEAQNEELLSQLVTYGKRVQAQKRSIAADGFLELQKQFQAERKIYDDNFKEIEKLRAKEFTLAEKTQQTLFGTGPAAANKARIEAIQAENEAMRDGLLVLEAQYNVRRKLIEPEGDPVDLNKEDEGGSMRKRSLDDIRDLEKEIQIAVIKGIIETHNAALDAEETGWAKRIEIHKKNLELKNRISELDMEIEIEKIRQQEKDKLAELNRPNKKNEIGFTGAQIYEQSLKIQKEANQKIEIAQKTHYENLVSNGNDAANKIRAIDEGIIDDRLEVVQDGYNKEIAAAKQAYLATAQTTKDKERLEKELERIAREAANAQIDMQIRILKAKLLNLDADAEVLESIQRQINALEAMRDVGGPDKDAEGSWYDYWMGVLDLTSEFAKATGDIVDGIYGRRIENINAEIQAERDKYDALLLLAKDDAVQTETLQRNRDLRLAQLDAKRLKEEQKQARARKAFAIADIGIKTAQAIMGIWAEVPKFDFGISAGLLTAFVSALGAAQIAAVIAQPIPKYKDGGHITKDEVAMINDGIHKEYIERNGKILTTDRKNAIVGLKKGDIVHKDYNALITNSAIGKLAGGNSIDEDEFNRLYMGITTSISKGFKQAKINNKVQVFHVNTDYRDKMSRW